MSEQLRLVVAPAVDAGRFAPADDWNHLGMLIDAMESRGYFLLVNSASTRRLKRMASFHLMTDQGIPCAGSSDWGPFPTIGEAVLRAAHEALFNPRWS